MRSSVKFVVKHLAFHFIMSYLREMRRHFWILHSKHIVIMVIPLSFFSSLCPSTNLLCCKETVYFWTVFGLVACCGLLNVLNGNCNQRRQTRGGNLRNLFIIGHQCKYKALHVKIIRFRFIVVLLGPCNTALTCPGIGTRHLKQCKVSFGSRL